MFSATESPVHLARGDVEIDLVERADAGELLDDAAHLQQRLRAVRIGSLGALGVRHASTSSCGDVPAT
jgi:hypothetical protein